MSTTVRRLLRRSTRARSAHEFVASCRDALRASPAHVAAALEAEYGAGEDPWHYATTPSARLRYEIALQMLDDAGVGRARHALEIGCGEGFFTERLAPRCDRVTAVDISALALERATRRCASHGNVSFRRWDVQTDAPLGVFDLVVCMDVLQYISRPRARRRAVAAVAAAVAPGGVLLLTGVRRPPFVEEARWTAWLPVSARADAALFTTSLRLVSSRTTEVHLVSLFRAPSGGTPAQSQPADSAEQQRDRGQPAD